MSDAVCVRAAGRQPALLVHAAAAYTEVAVPTGSPVPRGPRAAGGGSPRAIAGEVAPERDVLA